MATSIDLLPLCTIQSSGNDDVVQDVSDSIDTSRYTSAFAELQVFGKSGTVSLILEGSDDGQDFIELASRDLDGRETAILDRTKAMGHKSRLYRILRWRVHPVAAIWYVCGRIHLTLK